ncbi:MAG: cell wall-binding repeat-containing protein [Candidatus Saccharimonadales bacterium]
MQPPPSSTSTTGPPTTSTTQPAPPSGVSTTRESGQPPNRIGTAIAVSKSDYAAGNAQSVVVARNDVYADALTGGPLAAAKQGPLLLTEPSKLNSATAAEMQRVLPAGGTVYLLGGNAALAPNVANAIQALGYKVVRVSGPTRFATAVAVARQLGNPKVDFLATGLNFPDALSAGPAAVAQQAAILLSNGSSQSAVTAAYLASSQPATVYAVGGEACQADPQAICVADTDRFGTAVAVAQKFFPNPSTIGVATGLDFPDALAADPALGLEGSPIILVNPNVPLPANTLSYLSSTKSVRNIQVFGGSAAVSQSVVQQVLSALS